MPRYNLQLPYTQLIKVHLRKNCLTAKTKKFWFDILKNVLQ